jgi:RNA polymerase sigma factor (sigma-70 family)
MKATYIKSFKSKLISHKEALKNYALQLTKDRDNALDLVQETLLKAMRYESKFSKGTNLKGWLFTIMKNTFINEYRRNVKRNTFLDSTDNTFYLDSTPVKAKNDAELTFIRTDLESAISLLPKDLEYTFRRNMVGYKYHEIAEELDIPIGTVKTRIFVARKKLRTYLSEYEESFGFKSKA